MPTLGSDNEFPKVLLVEGAAPAAPAAGRIKLYAKSDGLLYWKDDAGTEYAAGGDISAHTGDTSDAHDASAISVADAGALYTATDVEAALAEIGAHPGDSNAAHAASAVSIADAGAYFTGTDVEAALQELGAGGGGGGGGLEDYGQGFHVGDLLPTSPGSYDEEFEGTADTLPANWSWADNTPTFYLNSRLPSWLYVDRGAGTTTTYTLRRSSFAPGTGTAWGLWTRVINGGRAGGYNWNVDFYVLNSDGSEARGLAISDTVAPSTLSIAASSESRSALGFTMNGPSLYMGITRDASDYWRGYLSQDGIGWVCVFGAGTNGATHAFTPARVEIRLKAQYNDAAPGRQGVDFIRFRTDTEFPRP